MKKIVFFLALLMAFIPMAFADIEEPLHIQTEDGNDNCFAQILKVSNGDLTDNADGTCSVDTSGGGGGGSGAFDDSSDPIVQNTTGKDVHIGDGAGTLTGKLEIGGDADQPQLVVEGHSTQTDSLIVGQNDGDTEVFNVDVDGDVKAQGIQDIDGPGTNWSISSAGTIDGVTLTEGGVGVPNTDDDLSVFAATTSAQLRGVLSDESGTGAALFAGGDIGAATGTSLSVTGNLSGEDLQLEDSDASHDLTITTTSNLTAARTLTLVPGDASRTLTLDGDPTLDDWFDQSVKTGATPTFAGADLSSGTATLGTVSGAIDAGGATSLEVPNSDTPTVDATGEIALDTAITGHTDLLIYRGGDAAEDKLVIAIPRDQLTTTDGQAITYNATDDEFEMTTVAGSGDITDVYDCSTGDCNSITLSDGDLLDMSSVSVSSTTEGLILPQHATDCSSAGTAEGQVCWEADADALYIGDGSTVKEIGAGGSDTNSVKTFVWPASATLPLEAADSIPPITKDTGTNVDVLTVSFDDSTDECRTVNFVVPTDVQSGSTITFGTIWYSQSATSGDVIWDFRHTATGTEGEDWDQSLTTEAAAADTVQGTVDLVTRTEWTETLANTGWAADDVISAAVCRDADNVSDDMTGDAELLTLYVEIPRE